MKNSVVVAEFTTGIAIVGILVREDQYTVSIKDPYEVDTMKPFTFYSESDTIDFQRGSLMALYPGRDVIKRLYEAKKDQYIKAGGFELIDSVIERVINMTNSMPTEIEKEARADEAMETFADLFNALKKDPGVKLN